MTFTTRAVLFLRGWRSFIRATEALLIDVISVTIPWMAPIVPAYMAFTAMTDALGFPVWVAICTAAVVELLGLACVNTIFEFWQFNQDKRKSDSKAPVIVAVSVSVFYLTVILTVNVMLDNAPIMHRAAKALLSLLTVCAGVVIALRAAHARRLEDIAQDKERRRQTRKARVNRPLAKQPTNGRGGKQEVLTR